MDVSIISTARNPRLIIQQHQYHLANEDRPSHSLLEFLKMCSTTVLSITVLSLRCVVSVVMTITSQTRVSWRRCLPAYFSRFFPFTVVGSTTTFMFVDIITALSLLLHRVSEKTVQNCFCQNFVKCPSILITFGRWMTKSLKFYAAYTFPPHLTHVFALPC